MANLGGADKAQTPLELVAMAGWQGMEKGMETSVTRTLQEAGLVRMTSWRMYFWLKALQVGCA